MKGRALFLAAAAVAGLAGGYALAFDSTAPDAAGGGREAVDDQGASVSVARRVVEAAGAFERYFRTASAVNPAFEGADSVTDALMTTAAYDSRQLEEGAVAYAALIALQQPKFVTTVSEYSANASERAAYVERLIAAPERVLDVDGGPEAAAMASSVLRDMGARLVSRGRSVTQASYNVQRQPWALEPAAERSQRLSQVEAAGRRSMRLSESETNRLLANIAARRQGAEGFSGTSAASPVILRGLVLAAAAVLGQAGDSRADTLSPLLSEPNGSACLRRAKLNLQQCLAASGTQYEDVFCAGQHAMAETGQCVVSAAGGQVADGVSVPIARSGYARNAAATVSVPVAREPSPAASRRVESSAVDQAREAQEPSSVSERSASGVRVVRPQTDDLSNKP